MSWIFLETRIFTLSDGEETWTLALFVLIQYGSVTDGQMDGHLCSGYTSAGKNRKKFNVAINAISPAVAELRSQKLKVPELTQLKMRGAGTPFRRVPPYFDPWSFPSDNHDFPTYHQFEHFN